MFRVGSFTSAGPTAGTRGTGNGKVGTPWGSESENRRPRCL